MYGFNEINDIIMPLKKKKKIGNKRASYTYTGESSVKTVGISRY